MPTYTVKFPDGQSVDFQGPKGMSDLDAYTRGTQERAVKEGKIQTTFAGGMAQGLATDPAMTHDLPQAVITGAGMLTGQPEIVAAAPAAARAVDYAIRSKTGQNPETPSAFDIGKDVVVGAATAYGPELVAKSGSALAANLGKLKGSTLPQAAAKTAATVMAQPVASAAAQMTPEAVGKATSDAIDLAKVEIPKGAATLVARAKGATVDDLRLMKQMVKQGFSPYIAAKTVSNNSPKYIETLVDWWAKVK